uniref:Metallo-beta-lactamase domain-containing protein n=1 Tax=Entomoneis paludosa TaxID=265537 RepID=A0A7S3DNF9_9STRA|mmetsp:Transcript_23513/g.48819  ORF Transcript_23513/g.48819 Transcript_23513/m.48819 type:complete len:198 (+) Transcript_23513:32-625(+)
MFRVCSRSSTLLLRQKTTLISPLPKNLKLFSTNMGGAVVHKDEKIGLKQLFDTESSTYTYLLWDQTTKDAILVDPVDILVDRDMKEVEDHGLKLVLGVNTHAHADHITGTGLLKQKIPGLKSVIAKASGAKADILVESGDKIVFGNRSLEVRSTPGHTTGCLSYVADDRSFVLTGDTLLIQGVSVLMFHSFLICTGT